MVWVKEAISADLGLAPVAKTGSPLARHHRCAGEEYVPGVEQAVVGTGTRLRTCGSDSAGDDGVVDTEANPRRAGVRRNVIALLEQYDVPVDQRSMGSLTTLPSRTIAACAAAARRNAARAARPGTPAEREHAR